MKPGVLVLALMAASALAVACQASGGGGGRPDGKALFQAKCMMCHDKVGMGTGLLARRVKPAELMLRTDLQSEYVVQAARMGVGNMPAIPRGEVSDADLRKIGDYLATPPAKRQ